MAQGLHALINNISMTPEGTHQRELPSVEDKTITRLKLQRLGTNVALLSKNVKVNHISLANRRWFKKMASPAPITKLFAMRLINAQKVMTLSGYWRIFEVS